MTDKPETPDAFPSPGRFGWTCGMTLLDYYAGQALAGFCALPDRREISDSYIAQEAYRLADLMLKERSK